MDNIRVRGYRDISFWQEDGIGLIVIKSDVNGIISRNCLDEMVSALGLASMDPNVKCVAFTGINKVFAKGMKPDGDDGRSLYELMQSSSSFLSMVYSLPKPIFSILNGDATNEGYEIALSSDLIISAEDANVGFNQEYQTILGGSFTAARFPLLAISKAQEAKNVDIVFKADSLLEDAKNYILKNFGNRMVQARRQKMYDISNKILLEKVWAYETYLMRSTERSR
ncbi:enoyl-CoA hydratase/isomerase family protein [Thermoplasma volcanium]|nr:enoyl-CoA hydratase/isomerase family protein [Thermoplasma volcanium]